jgi:hypothetical protein
LGDGEKGELMSKLIEKLQRISEGGGQPMGFGAAVARTKISQILTIAGVPSGNAQLITAAMKEGPDALLLAVDNMEKDSKALAKMNREKIEIPWGVSLKTVDREDIAKLIELGCDYVVFSPDKAPAAVLMEEKIGKVLKIDTSLPESLAKAVNRLQVDAVLLSPAGGDEPTFTVHQLMILERLAGSTGKHILVTMPSGLSTGDIEIFWGLGVRGLIVDMETDQPEQRLSQIKEAIQKLPTTRKNPKEKFRATLPAASRSPEKEKQEEEEEEEEP